MKVALDGRSLDVRQVVAVARDRAEVEVADWSRLEASRAWVDAHVAAWRSGGGEQPVYGITTGFGSSRNVRLDADALEAAQVNLVRSHAIGVALGEADWFDDEVVRAAGLLRANTFLDGRSGVRREVVELLLRLLADGITPRVPLRGSVGASGDLSPLAHFALVLIGEGEVTWGAGAQRRRGPASDAFRASGLEALHLRAKEGLALINGTTFSTAMLAFALHEAENVARAADVACALSLEALGGCGRALDPKLHDARGHAGQRESAAGLRALLEGSRRLSATDDRQDNYSLRCAPQVHGASRDALAHSLRTCEIELNAVTDNPLLFALEGDGPSWDADAAAANAGRFGREPDRSPAYSGGNFHGQPVGLAADIASIAVAELASISERRLALLVNPAFSRGLPAHLSPRPGVESGLMLAQYSAAALVSENKTLAHPASVDSIPTGNGAEDHVPMSTWAARKARAIVANAAQVVALELLAAAQAHDWRTLRPDPSLRAAPAAGEDDARRFAGVSADAVAAELGTGTARAYRRVRELSARVVEDRSLAPDVGALARAVLRGDFAEGALPLRRDAP